MKSITLKTSPQKLDSFDLLALPVFQCKAGLEAQLKTLLGVEALEVVKTIVKVAKQEGFEGKDNQKLKVVIEFGNNKATKGKSSTTPATVLLVGQGSQSDATVAAKRLAVEALRAAGKRASVAILATDAYEEHVSAMAEGSATGGYRYDAFKTTKESHPKQRVTLVVKVKSKLHNGGGAADEGLIVGEAINWVRDLVNAPPNELNPVELANRAAQQAKKLGIKSTLWNKARLQKEKMNLFLAVNRGSAVEPRLVHLVYKPKLESSKKLPRVAFVGKGVTFDSGGLCLKPAKAMIDMKCDMAGAAVTLGIVFAASKLNLPVEVHAVVGATENMGGESAYRPGDVFRSHQGKTVEIINTDAEGRLVLADVLSWTKQALSPDLIVDHATLTGACMVALGQYTAGLFCNDAALADRYARAAQAAGESVWQMPLDEHLKPSLQSFVADVKHVGGPYGGSITAALFLREFIGDTPWAHLDIAGPSFLDRAHGINPRGATGFGVATGVQFLKDLAAGK